MPVVRFSPDSSRLFTAGYPQRRGPAALQFWDVATGKKTRSLLAPGLASLVFTPDGNLLEIQSGKIIPIKGTALDPENFTADDWKWSVNAEKTFAHHVQISGQIANDHFIPRPVRSGLINESSGLSEVLTSTKDWYFMARVGYFF